MVNDMKLMYNDKEIELVECKSFFSRLKGFMFERKINNALLFNRCNSIHTFFMKKEIDVIMCDSNNLILYYFPKLGKNKVILPKKGAVMTIELPVNYFDFKINERILIK